MRTPTEGSLLCAPMLRVDTRRARVSARIALLVACSVVRMCVWIVCAPCTEGGLNAHRFQSPTGGSGGGYSNLRTWKTVVPRARDAERKDQLKCLSLTRYNCDYLLGCLNAVWLTQWILGLSKAYSMDSKVEQAGESG